MIDLELVVFDLVGTTIQDRGEVPGALQEAMLEHGLEVAANDLKHLRGLSKRELIARLLGENSQAAHQGLEAKADAVVACMPWKAAQKPSPGCRLIALRSC